GSFGGGVVTERLGRRRVIAVCAAAHGVGLVALGIAPTWLPFVAAALPAGLGAGAIDGGINGLVLDAGSRGRGRALNNLHLFFSIGALTSPLVAGRLVDVGLAWQAIVAGSGLAAVVLAVAVGALPMPDGRHPRRAGAERAVDPTRPGAPRSLRTW